MVQQNIKNNKIMRNYKITRNTLKQRIKQMSGYTIFGKKKSGLIV